MGPPPPNNTDRPWTYTGSIYVPFESGRRDAPTRLSTQHERRLQHDRCMRGFAPASAEHRRRPHQRVVIMEPGLLELV